ncbi:SigE family RNA polymerase sigma factor [Nocardioides taihuensis]|uniref:SigE family RNA polymerase sigma factor n=1 Tax=Nocardioides taihuensis TaxID=1835606 RepID=A0ABW0BRH4_9ACTN
MSADADAEFEAFVRGTWPTLRQAAFALTRDRTQAEDLLQDVLTRTYARWRTVGRGDPVAYVRRALVNAYVDTWRRSRRIREEPTDPPPDRPAHDGTDDRLAARADVEDLLANLTPRERAIVVLRHYFDLPEAEVAATLGCSVGTVKSTCSRALQRLRVLAAPSQEELS